MQIWLLPIVAGSFILSQIVALFTTHVESLWIVSSLLGVSYGCLFNVVPMLVLEWFGMGQFRFQYYIWNTVVQSADDLAHFSQVAVF
jgi:MFS family permease